MLPTLPTLLGGVVGPTLSVSDDAEKDLLVVSVRLRLGRLLLLPLSCMIGDCDGWFGTKTEPRAVKPG